jgi:hypothetical protein
VLTSAVTPRGVGPSSRAHAGVSDLARPNEALLDLLTTASGPTEPFCPLSRRLYFATMYGFGNLLTGEKELTSLC